jgi:hypothetical protein
MAFDVLLNADVPLADRRGPDAWPYEIARVADDAPEPAAPWQRMTEEAYAAYVAARQAEYDAWRIVNRDMPRLRAQAVGAVKSEALRRIGALFGKTDPTDLVFAEVNMISRGVELVNTGQGQSEEALAIQARWDAVKAVRAASNAIESDAPALSSPKAATDFIDGVPADPRWPA